MSWIFDSVPPAAAPKDTRQEPPCPECCGEGFIEVTNGPGTFDECREAWMPSCEVEPCAACRGTGVQDHDEMDETDDTSSAEECYRTEDHDVSLEGAESALPF